MPFTIVRNDITKMTTDAIVNTANRYPKADTGCDYAVYQAAGYDELLAYRREKIGEKQEGDVFITPGFALAARWIIHAVSPYYVDGNHGEEEKLRGCYRKSLALAAEYGLQSVAFPLIATGGFGYPKEEGLRIAVDEISAFLMDHSMMVYVVVFDEKSTSLGQGLWPGMQEYIDAHMVKRMEAAEYSMAPRAAKRPFANLFEKRREAKREPDFCLPSPSMREESFEAAEKAAESADWYDEDVQDTLNQKLAERIAHRQDTFSEYLQYLIQRNGMENDEVYKRAIVDKKLFSKIKNHKDYHPQKITALCLCVGAKLSLDDTKDLLARAGYALSPSDMTDIIFSFFIEQEHYDVVDIDIQLETYGLPCIIE